MIQNLGKKKMKILTKKQIRRIGTQIIALQKMANAYDTANQKEQIEIFDKMTENLADIACEI